MLLLLLLLLRWRRCRSWLQLLLVESIKGRL